MEQVQCFTYKETPKALAYCYRSMSSYTPWINLWGSSNTTVDSNGFIKRASPVININPDGTFTTNDESRRR